jgi:hypothetical protein
VSVWIFFYQKLKYPSLFTILLFDLYHDFSENCLDDDCGHRGLQRRNAKEDERHNHGDTEAPMVAPLHQRPMQTLQGMTRVVLALRGVTAREPVHVQIRCAACSE